MKREKPKSESSGLKKEKRSGTESQSVKGKITSSVGQSPQRGKFHCRPAYVN